MKVLLLNPPSLPGTTTDRRQRCTVKSPMHLVHPPVALAYLAAVLDQWNGMETVILDAVIERKSVEDIIAVVKEYGPDLIVAAVGSYTFRWDLAALRPLKEVRGVPVAVFGELPTALPEMILAENPHIDYCVLGESELAVSHIADVARGTRDVDRAANIAYRRDGAVVRASQQLIEDLDTLPYPRRELLDNTAYHCVPFLTQTYTDLITSRGCPYHCKFCTTNSYWGRKHRKRSPENILGEVKECLRRFGIRHFFIPDETFTVDREWVGRLNQGFRQLGARWALQTRVDLVTPDLLREMAAGGCVYIHYGVESGSQKILDYYRKGITVQQIRDAFAWTREAGIEVNASFIIGSPEETRETADRTIRLAREIRADYTHFSPLVPLPLSEFYREFKEQGLLVHERFEEYVKPNIVFKPKYMSPDEITAAIRRAYRATVMSPAGIMRYALRVLKRRDSAEFKRLVTAGKWVMDNFFGK